LVQYADLREIVASRAQLDPAPADRALEATVQALAEQAPPAAVAELAKRLPPALAGHSEGQRGAETRTLTGFLERVAALSEMPTDQVHRPVLAVLAALSAGLPSEVIHGVLDPLGDDYTALLPPPHELRDSTAFLETVRQRTGAATSAEAEAATGAVLATLAERLSAGQAQALAGYLPADLRPALGETRSEARPFDYAEFLAGIASQREPAEIRARGVLVTLREVTPEPEIQDALAQLPEPLTHLFT
jgi:uncharacterized protein (DUF2267 family)